MNVDEEHDEDEGRGQVYGCGRNVSVVCLDDGLCGPGIWSGGMDWDEQILTKLDQYRGSLTLWDVE